MYSASRVWFAMPGLTRWQMVVFFSRHGSKAKTVGEAPWFHSYPHDWCWDYERGFIRVLGGHIRDEPFDTSNLYADSLTSVHRAIQTRHVRELAIKLESPVSVFQVNQENGETLGISYFSAACPEECERYIDSGRLRRLYRYRR